MKYSMNSPYGLSSETNEYIKENPVHRDGQGSESGPPDWGLKSNMCLERYSEEANRCIIKDPAGDLHQARDMGLFVDDMLAQHNGGRYNCTEEELMTMTHHDINLWDKTLNVA
eukprot:8007414-Ditylum_brightwellii.AAC.1